MKIFCFLVFLVTLLHFQVAFSSDESKAEAETLLNSLEIETAFEQSVEQMLQLQLQQRPALAPYKKVMLQFFSKHMSYNSLRDDMIKLYAEAFTAPELKDINNFYATQTGKKTLRLMPELMAKGGQLGAQRVQDNIQELQNMIKAE